MEVQDYHNYLIYEDGSVYSKKRKKFLKPSDVLGYLQINLYKDGKYKYFYVHRLVALHYIPNPHNYPEVDHIDRDRQNNSIDNLRWVTKTMNCQNTEVRKNNKLRIKNISPHSRSGYNFEKLINGKRHCKYFKTLEEAIKYKEEYFTNLQLQ